LKLSVIISNRNDTKMLSITVRSCIEALKPLGLNNCEIIIVDNSDEEIYKSLPGYLPTGYIRDGLLKIYRQNFPCLFTARETAAEYAISPYISCIDSHMLIGHNMFLDLYEFMDFHSDNPKIAFAHAPINWAHHHESRSRHDRDMTEHELGPWGRAYKTERKITWKGMPWICRKDFFLNTLNGYGALSQHKISWGGGDMHIGIKPWLLGYENWAVPTSPGIHIGPFPADNITKDVVKIDKNPDRYRLYSTSGNGPHTFGFLVSCYVLGGMPMIERNRAKITEKFGRFINVEKWIPKAIKYGQEEKDWLDSVKVMSFEELLAKEPWNAS
jgi:glycosyltransferase involved in cell wall biosynthesis